MSQPTCNQGTNIKLFQAMHDAGFTLFPMYGYNKIPHKGFLDTPFEPNWTPQDGHNYGALLRRRFLVIDVDPRHYPEGRKPFRELMAALQMPLDIQKTTFTVKTPRGGYHIYFQKPESCTIVHALKAYPGLEFKDRHIVCPGSYIFQDDKGKAVNGGYTVFNGSPTAIAQADPRLLAMLKPQERKEQVLVGEITPDQMADIRWFMSFCQTTPPAVAGHNGDKTAFGVARAGRAKGLSKEKVAEIMLGQYNPRCEPPDEDWIRAKVDNAFAYADEPAGVTSIQNDFEAVKMEPGVEVVKSRWKMDHNGQLKKCFFNLSQFMYYPAIVQGADGGIQDFKIVPIGRHLAFDSFSGRVLWAKAAPWFKSSGEWEDSDAILFKAMLADKTYLDFNVGEIHEAAVACARKHIIHPVRDYLESLKWDGVPRLTGWLGKYCGALRNEYTDFVGRKVLIAAVARVFRPGCKFDHVLVMEGKQGLGKTYLWELLASPWYTSAPLNISDKSAVEIMQGKWVIELDEMEALTKYESQTIKGFLTRNEDRVRMAYARTAQNFPRQCIFVGGLNPEQTGWLKDRTGNRRYWPVPVFDIDLKAVKADRDQLWAEARQAFELGEAIHVDNDRMRDLMAQEVEARVQEDSWHGIIATWLGNEENLREFLQTDGKTAALSPVDIYTKAIGGGAAAFHRSEMNRVVTSLKSLGWDKRYDAVNRVYYYAREIKKEL